MHRKQILADLKKFATELANMPPDAQSKGTPFVPSTMFANAEYGVISFSAETAQRYGEIIHELGKTVADSMSQGSVTKLVQIAAFSKRLTFEKRTSRYQLKIARTKA